MGFQTKNEIAQNLRGYGVQPTAQRVEIAHVLFANAKQKDMGHHLSAEDVLEQVNVDFNRVSKATVYNTLWLFEEIGLIQAVVVSSNKVFFDANTAPHHHLYDEATGTLQDIPAEEIDPAQLMPHLPNGVSPEDLDIVVRIRS